MHSFNAISLFSNCGAGDYGFSKAGFKFQVMAEIVPSRLGVCMLNHNHAVPVPGDLRETWPSVINAYLDRAGSQPLSLLAACPPCQGMSSARANRGLASDPDAGTRDERNLLVQVVVNVARELMPKFIVVENVPDFFLRLVWHPDFEEPLTAAQILTRQLEVLYKPFPIITDLAKFGVPQSRNRGFLVMVLRNSSEHDFLLKNGKLPYPKPQDKTITVTDFLKSQNLPHLDSSTRSTAESSFANGLHSVPLLTEAQYRMVSAIPPYSGKSAWQNQTCTVCNHEENLKTAIVCSKCQNFLPKPIFHSKEGVRLIKGFKNSYKRMNADRPSATITTASATITSHNTIHPFENRVLSTWECALLQTFDSDFSWGDAIARYGHASIRAMIGEAVPPLFTYQIGQILVSLIQGEKIDDAADINLPEHKQTLKKLFNSPSKKIRKGSLGTQLALLP